MDSINIFQSSKWRAAGYTGYMQNIQNKFKNEILSMKTTFDDFYTKNYLQGKLINIWKNAGIFCIVNLKEVKDKLNDKEIYSK